MIGWWSRFRPRVHGGHALTRLIDHAALFPPAPLSMPEALAEDRRVRAEPTGWLVNRFVVPAHASPSSRGADLPLSVVLDRRVGPDDSRIEAVEVPGDPDGPVVSTAEVYVELPADADVARIPELAARGLRAKLRCGGASVPSIALAAASSAPAVATASPSRQRRACTTPSAAAASTAS